MDTPALTEDEAKAARRIVPPVMTPSRPVPLDSPRIPRGTRTAINAAAGWDVGLFYACGPRLAADGRVLDGASHSLGLRARRGGQLVVMTWRWTAQAWKFEDAYLAPGLQREIEGAAYRLPIEKVTSTEATQTLRGGTP